MNKNSRFGIQGSERKESYPHSAFAIPHSRGFTLLEVLLAMAILTIVASAVYASFATAGRMVEQAGEVRDGTDLARTLLARITSDIANVYVNPGMTETFLLGRKVEDEEQRKRYDGIYLTTLTNWRKPESREMELWEVGYYFQDRPDGKGRVLFRKEKRELSKDAPPLEGTTDYELTDTVADLRFRYYTGSTWSDEWDTRTQGRVPRAVEIILSLDGGRVYMTTTEIKNP
jgi:general secretion pathway protein J